MITAAEERQAAHDRAYAGLPFRGTWNAATRSAALQGYAEGLVARAARTDLTSFIVVERDKNTDRLRATCLNSREAAEFLVRKIEGAGHSFALVVPVTRNMWSDVMADRVPTGTLAAMADFIASQVEETADEDPDYERRAMGLTARD